VKKQSIVILVVFCIAAWSLPAMAQRYFDSKEADQFFPDFQADRDMIATGVERTPTRFTVQYGGWLMPVFLTDYRGEAKQLNTSITTLNVWLKTYLWQNAFIYIRIKDTLTGIMHQEGYPGLDEVDNLFDLDVGYVSAAFLDGMIRLNFGRRFFMVGSGLVFNGRGDGVQFDVVSRWVRFSVFGLYTGLIHKDNNLYELSSRDYSDGAKRIFTGGEVAFPFENQQLYLLALGQFDLSEETAGDRHKYHSQYVGGGIKGLIADAVSYSAEYVYQMGTTFDTNNTKQKISAMAAGFSLDWYISAVTNPVLMVQYNYASGDRHRSSYLSSQIGSSGGYDTGFIGFGTFVAGYALRPQPGNLHVFRAGFALSPFSWARQFYVKRMTLIAKYAYYMKDKKDGAIGSGEATLNEFSVGHGVDVSLRWKILSDLSFFVNYAVFLPGDAFLSSENDRHFVMEGISLSF
jgi:hypothetical protein